MATSIQAFRTGLYEEHVDEISFLYSQRRHLLSETSLAWRDLAPFERRLELHLDALVIGADLAGSVCHRSATEDAGRVFAAVSLLCRLRRAAQLSEVISKVDGGDDDSLVALGDALKYELPTEWVSFLERALVRQDARLLPGLATACGYRRIPCDSTLVELLGLRPAASRSIVEALGRLRSPSARSALLQCLRDDDASLRSEALLALLRIGVEPPVRACYLVAQTEAWPRLALGLAGDAAALRVLMHPAGGHPDAAGIHAVGLLGMPRSVPYLCECLSDPALAEVAAQALNWICGADLYEDVLVEEPVNEDEMFPREIEAWREHGVRPQTLDGRSFGTVERKLTTDAGRWSEWIRGNARHFDADCRYRGGNLYSPKALVQSLSRPDTDKRLRELIGHELVIRYGCDVPMESDMPVVLQFEAIRRMAAWVTERENRFVPGGWHLNGRPQ